MTADEFQHWAGEHCKVFGLSVEEATTVLSWEPYFIAAGFHPHDLADTTSALVKNPQEIIRLAGSAKFVGKMAMHLAAVEGYIREQSARRSEPEPDGYDQKHGTCLVCGSSGYVTVPHLRGITAGRWVGVKLGGMKPQFYTCAVLCSCSLGRWKGQRQGADRRGKPGKRTMSLEAYEAENPAWKEQMESRQAARVERAKIGNPNLGAEIVALAERFQVRRS